jgi:hypothetical protein
MPGISLTRLRLVSGWAVFWYRAALVSTDYWMSRSFDGKLWPASLDSEATWTKPWVWSMVLNSLAGIPLYPVRLLSHETAIFLTRPTSCSRAGFGRGPSGLEGRLLREGRPGRCCMPFPGGRLAATPCRCHNTRVARIRPNEPPRGRTSVRWRNTEQRLRSPTRYCLEETLSRRFAGSRPCHTTLSGAPSIDLLKDRSSPARDVTRRL